MAPQTDMRQASDEAILADPGSHTVDEVLAVFARSTPGQVAVAQALEAAGEKRKGIAHFDMPDPPADPGEPRFSRERVLGADGEKLTGQPHHVIVGALHGDSRQEFTRAQVNRAVEVFLTRPVEQEG